MNTALNNQYISPINRPQPNHEGIAEAEKKFQKPVSSAISGPGISGLVTSPVEIYRALQRIYKGVHCLNPFSVAEGTTLFANHSFSVIYGLFSLSRCVMIICDIASKVFGNHQAKLSTLVNILNCPAITVMTLGFGIVINTINTVFECAGLIQQAELRSRYQFSSEINEKNVNEKLKALLKDVSPTHPKNNLHKLNNTIAPWLVSEIQYEIRTMHSNSEPTATKEERQRAVTWLKDIHKLMDIQSRKAILVHLVGLAAIAICVAATIVGLSSLPYALPIFALLVILSAGFAIARSAINSGYCNSRGWTFRPINLIPLSLIRFFKTLTEEIKQAKISTDETKNSTDAPLRSSDLLRFSSSLPL